MPRWLLLLLTCYAATAMADDSLYKCRTDDGAVSYQSAPCAMNQRTEWHRAVERDEPLSASELAERRRQLEADADFLARLAGRGRHPRSSPPRRATRPSIDRCAAAQAQRTAKLEAVGLARNFALLRRLDAAVAKACRR